MFHDIKSFDLVPNALMSTFLNAHRDGCVRTTLVLFCKCVCSFEWKSCIVHINGWAKVMNSHCIWVTAIRKQWIVLLFGQNTHRHTQKISCLRRNTMKVIKSSTYSLCIKYPVLLSNYKYLSGSAFFIYFHSIPALRPPHPSLILILSTVFFFLSVTQVQTMSRIMTARHVNCRTCREKISLVFTV